MRVLGIDYGSARLGVAIGDTETRIASPWCVLDMHRRDQVLASLRSIIQAEAIESIVLGMPHPLSDQTRSTAQTQEIQAFHQDLAQLGIPVHEENETWSSKLAATYTHELEQKGKRDDLAAAVILQSYLDRHGLSA